MPIYEITPNQISPISESNFSDLGLRERDDLQRLLKKQIDVISPETLVIAEEFGEWDESRRRIDLLGIDKNANLVVIELKRTNDGGHMELQAVRYAAMVANMTFERATQVYGRYLESEGEDFEVAEQMLLDFLAWDEADEDSFAQDVKIVLASAEFSKELTSTVLWLNERDLDIRCVRMKPYKDGDRTLLDVQMVIPLPEAEAYQIQIKEKKQKEKIHRDSNRDVTRFQLTLDNQNYHDLPKRRLIYILCRKLFDIGHSPIDIQPYIGKNFSVLFKEFDGKLTENEVFDGLIEMGVKPGRFFYKEDELFHWEGKTYTLSNQWGMKRLRILVDNLQKSHPFEFNITPDVH